MWRSAWIVVLAVGATAAHADDDTQVRAATEAPEAPTPLERVPLLPSQIEGLGAEEQRDSLRWRWGRTSVVVDGVRWRRVDDEALPTVDLPGHGWGAGTWLSHDLGIVQLGAGASIHRVDVPLLGRGHHLDLGLSLGRSFRLSRWMIGWISLGIGRRRWLGGAPQGEADATAVMLTIGTTFR